MEQVYNKRRKLYMNAIGALADATDCKISKLESDMGVEHP